MNTGTIFLVLTTDSKNRQSSFYALVLVQDASECWWTASTKIYKTSKTFPPFDVLLLQVYQLHVDVLRMSIFGKHLVNKHWTTICRRRCQKSSVTLSLISDTLMIVDGIRGEDAGKLTTRIKTSFRKLFPRTGEDWRQFSAKTWQTFLDSFCWFIRQWDKGQFGLNSFFSFL